MMTQGLRSSYGVSYDEGMDIEIRHTASGGRVTDTETGVTVARFADQRYALLWAAELNEDESYTPWLGAE